MSSTAGDLQQSAVDIDECCHCQTTLKLINGFSLEVKIQIYHIYSL